MPSLKSIIQKNKAKLLETKEDKETRLHIAADNDKTLDIRMLLQGGTDVNCRGNIAEWTPLHVASSCGHVETIRVLLSFNAAIDAQDKVMCISVLYQVTLPMQGNMSCDILCFSSVARPYSMRSRIVTKMQFNSY